MVNFGKVSSADAAILNFTFPEAQKASTRRILPQYQAIFQEQAPVSFREGEATSQNEQTMTLCASGSLIKEMNKAYPLFIERIADARTI